MPTVSETLARQLAVPTAFSAVRERFPHLSPEEQSALVMWLLEVLPEYAAAHLRLLPSEPNKLEREP